jgi:hypothetical protein
MGEGLIVGGVIVVLPVALVLWPKPEDRGRGTFFSDRTYSFEALRPFFRSPDDLSDGRAPTVAGSTRLPRSNVQCGISFNMGCWWKLEG